MDPSRDRLIVRAHEALGDRQLRRVPELSDLPPARRRELWERCYPQVVADCGILFRRLTMVLNVLSIAGVVAGALLGWWQGGPLAAFVGLVLGAGLGGFVGGLLRGVAVRRFARPYLARELAEETARR